MPQTRKALVSFLFNKSSPASPSLVFVFWRHLTTESHIAFYLDILPHVQNYEYKWQINNRISSNAPIRPFSLPSIPGPFFSRKPAIQHQSVDWFLHPSDPPLLDIMFGCGRYFFFQRKTTPAQPLALGLSWLLLYARYVNSQDLFMKFVKGFSLDSFSFSSFYFHRKKIKFDLKDNTQ